MHVLHPITSEYIARYQEAVYHWAQTYLELGISRSDLQALCRAERNPKDALLSAALVAAFQRQDNLRAAVIDRGIELKLFPVALVKLITHLAIP